MQLRLGYILAVCGWLFGATPQTLLAQNTHQQLAKQYYNQGNFEDAATYFLKSYKKTNSSKDFDLYISSLANSNQFSVAQKALKKEIKRRPNQLQLQITLGDLYERDKQPENAQKAWSQVISYVDKNPNQVIPTAYAFIQVNQPTYAIQCYEIGQQKVPGFQSYYPQMADLYGEVGNYEQMINTYLLLIEFNPVYIQLVQNRLMRNFNFEEPDANTLLLQKKLLQQSNKNPNNPLYSEMLIWMNLQLRDYEMAFTQVKSLDKRLKENGNRLMNFAQLAQQKQQYSLALAAYEIVVKKGPNYPFYESASFQMLHTKKQQLEANPLTPKKEYLTLTKQYTATLTRFGISDKSAGVVRELAEIEAKNLQNYPQAIKLLSEMLDTERLNPEEVAHTKIDLGDYLLIQGNIWQAVLYYMQAEKAFKYDELGDEAKLRSAKVAYYTGDFAWAAAKLNVLKGSTSKLISNDALYLSNLITDNTTIDTNLRPMELYATADLLQVQHNYMGALQRLDSIQEYFPDHMLADEVLMLKAKIYMAMQDYPSAESQLKNIYISYAYDILGDDAVFMLAELYEFYLNEPEKAKEYYLILMTDFSSSVLTTEARKRYRKLRGDSV